MIGMQRYLDDIALAQLAIEQYKLNEIVADRPLICELYSIPAHQHQSFYLQIFGGEHYTILYAKPYIQKYNGQAIAMYLFADALEANLHPAHKGGIYCGIKHLPAKDQFVEMLLTCLPRADEEAGLDRFVIDGVTTIVINHTEGGSCTLAFKLVEAIAVNQYTTEQKNFLDNLYLYVEGIIGNLLDSCNGRSPSDWLFQAWNTDRQYNEAWGKYKIYEE